MVCGIYKRCGQGEGKLQLVFCYNARDKTERLGLEKWRMSTVSLPQEVFICSCLLRFLLFCFVFPPLTYCFGVIYFLCDGMVNSFKLEFSL